MDAVVESHHGLISIEPFDTMDGVWAYVGEQQIGPCDVMNTNKVGQGIMDKHGTRTPVITDVAITTGSAHIGNQKCNCCEVHHVKRDA